MPVAYCLHSEAKLLELNNINIRNLQPARADGWTHSIWHNEPKLPEVEYVLFPGN